MESQKRFITFAARDSRELLAKSLYVANRAVQTELIVALRAPQEKLVGLIRARANDLHETSKVMDSLVEEQARENWGVF